MAAQNIIYQEFILDHQKYLKKIEVKGGARDDIRARSHDSGRNLVSELRSMGYEVIQSSNVVAGISSRVIIGRDVLKGVSHKEDFYGLARKLDLPFSSGDMFTGSRES